MRKLLFYGVGVAVALGALSVHAQTTDAIFGVSQLYGAPSGTTFDLAAPQGSVTINNIYNLPLIVDGEYLIIEDNSDFQINYNTNTSQFDLYFMSQPAAQLQSQGEKKLLDILGVTQANACKLNVLEEYPDHYMLASYANGLSFCGASGNGGTAGSGAGSGFSQ